jgi:hypothetical protein
MEDLIEDLTGDHVPDLKVILTFVVTALAGYQVFMMAVGYGKLRLPFLGPRAAAIAHRSAGDGIVAVTLLVGWLCNAYFGVGDGIEDARPGDHTRVVVHVVLGFLLFATLAVKIAVVRWWHRWNRYLPVLGISVFILFVSLWLTSVAPFL